jgi:hypothetical protein
VRDISAHREECEVHEEFGFFCFFNFRFLGLIVVFVIFVSSVVDTSSEQTQNSPIYIFELRATMLASSRSLGKFLRQNGPPPLGDVADLEKETLK